MSSNNKGSKSIGMRIKEVGRRAIGGVRKRPWVSGVVAFAVIALVAGVFLRGKIQRMIAGTTPSVAELQKDATTTTRPNSGARWATRSSPRATPSPRSRPTIARCRSIDGGR